MLHIILGILKVIGILLAVVILLLLGIVLAVLFVPVRYQVSAAKTPEKLAARIRVTWFFKLFSVLFAYDHGERRRILEIRIFGIPLDTIKKFLQKRSGQKQKRMAEKAKREAGKVKREAEKAKREAEKAEQQSEAPSYAGLDEHEESVPDAEPVPIASEDANPDTEPAPGSHEESDSESIPEKKKRSFGERIQNLKYKLQAVCDKIREIVLAVKNVFCKVRSILQNIAQMPAKISQVLEKLAQIPEKISEFQRLLEKYEAKELLHTIWKEVEHLIRCYAPRKIRGYLRFGTGDPAKTGQILGIIYLLLPVRASEFSLQPEFTEEVFETDIHISGHIRVNHVVAVAWRLFRNKKLMRAIKMLRKERRK